MPCPTNKWRRPTHVKLINGNTLSINGKPVDTVAVRFAIQLIRAKKFVAAVALIHDSVPDIGISHAEDFANYLQEAINPAPLKYIVDLDARYFLSKEIKS